MDTVSNDSELLHDIAKGVQGPIDAALAELSTFGTVARTLLAIAEQSGRRPGRADLAKIREHLQTQLRGPDSATAGIGIAVGVDYLHDSPYWLEWWRFGRRGELEFVAHSLNPNRDAFYDYSSRPWFSAPAASGRTTITGPYVDIGGTNTYTVTLSLPLLTEAGFAGVASADSPAAAFEPFLIRPGRLRPVVLTNAALRVIASSSSDYLPGSLLSSALVEPWTVLSVAGRGLHGQAPWLLMLPIEKR